MKENRAKKQYGIQVRSERFKLSFPPHEISLHLCVLWDPNYSCKWKE